jgi:hypothetical protein
MNKSRKLLTLIALAVFSAMQLNDNDRAGAEMLLKWAGAQNGHARRSPLAEDFKACLRIARKTEIHWRWTIYQR